MVNSLGKGAKYRDKVVFLEHFVDSRTEVENARRARFWATKGGATNATTPLVIVDSGFKATEGYAKSGENFGLYAKHLDAALEQPPLVAIDAGFDREGVTNNLVVTGKITNIGTETLGYENTATLWLMAFEEKRPAVIHVDWFVRDMLRAELDDDLDPGASQDFRLRMVGLPSETNMATVQLLVLLEYKPESGSSKYVSANAALAVRTKMTPPRNDNINSVEFVEALPYTHSVDTSWATDETGEVRASCATGTENGAWYEYVPLNDENVRIQAEMAGGGVVVLSAWTSDEARHPLTEVGCAVGDSGPADLAVALKADKRYFIKVGGANGKGGVTQLSITSVGGQPTPQVTTPAPTTPPPTTPTTPEPTTPPPTVENPTPVPTTPPPDSHETIFLPGLRRGVE